MALIVPINRRQAHGPGRGFKPYPWNVNPARVAPEWGRFWNHPNLVSAWIFWEGQGDTIYDWGPSRKNGVIEDSSADVFWQPDQRGTAVNFTNDGTNDRVDLGSITSANRLSMFGATSLSVLWGGNHTYAADKEAGRLIDKSDAGVGAKGWALWFDHGPTFGGLDFGIDGTQEASSSTGFMIEDEYHDYAFVLSALTGTNHHYYRDGILTESVANDTVAFPADTVNMAIGNWNHSHSRMWSGTISYMYVFDGDVSRSLVSLIARDPFGPFRMDHRQFGLISEAEAAAAGTDFSYRVIYNVAQ